MATKKAKEIDVVEENVTVDDGLETFTFPKQNKVVRASNLQEAMKKAGLIDPDL